jgi:cytochrome c biogenesis protein CcdA
LKRSRRIQYHGLDLPISVFTTYFLVGAGVLKFLVEVPFFSVIARWVYIIMAVIAVVMGFMSIFDAIKARRGDFGDMLLQLPSGLKKRINRTIMDSNSARSKRNFIIAAASTGFLVSLMELACTGQVYLPTIILMTRSPDVRGLALLYLGLYNLMFILPLIVVFMVALAGTSSIQLSSFLKKHTAKIKIILAILFFAMAYFLLKGILF